MGAKRRERCQGGPPVHHRRAAAACCRKPCRALARAGACEHAQEGEGALAEAPAQFNPEDAIRNQSSPGSSLRFLLAAVVWQLFAPRLLDMHDAMSLCSSSSPFDLKK